MAPKILNTSRHHWKSSFTAVDGFSSGQGGWEGGSGDLERSWQVWGTKDLLTCRQSSLLGTWSEPIDQILNVPGENGYVLSRLRVSTQESCYRMNKPGLLTTVFLFSMPRMKKHRTVSLVYNKIWWRDWLTIHQLKQNALINCRWDWHINMLPLFSHCPHAAANEVCFTLCRWGLCMNHQFNTFKINSKYDMHILERP